MLVCGGIFPRIIAQFAGVWYGVKYPSQFTRPHIVSPNVSRRGIGGFVNPAADNVQVLIDNTRRSGGYIHFAGIAAQVVMQVDFAAVTKTGYQLAVSCIYSIDI